MTATTSPPVPPTTGARGRLPLTRGRRAALAIGAPVCLLLVAGTGLSLVADLGEARFPVSYSVPADSSSLSVTSSGGHLTVRQGPGRATVTGTATYSLVHSALTEHRDGRGTVVDYACKFWLGDCELDATVSTPAALPVSADSGGGDAQVTGTAGPVALATGGGNLSADHVSGPLRLATGGGDIQATAISSAAITATSGGGNIEIVFTRVPRDVEVDTSGGDITLVLPPGPTQYRVTAHTGGGDVSDTLPQSSSSADVITASSGGGNLTIRRPQS